METPEKILYGIYTERKKYKKTIVYDERKLLRAERIAKLEKLDENNRKNK